MSSLRPVDGMEAWMKRVDRELRMLQQTARRNGANLTVNLNPPTPTAPAVAETSGQALVTWDGGYTDWTDEEEPYGVASPEHVEGVEVHAVAQVGEAAVDTLLGTVNGTSGGTLSAPLPPGEYEVYLRSFTSAKVGLPSEIRVLEISGMVTADEVAIAIGDVMEQITGLEGRLDGQSEIWYQPTEPTHDENGNPLGIDDTGDIWVNTSTTPSTFWAWDGQEWTPISDPELLDLLDKINGKVTTYWSDEEPTPPADGFTVGDLWFDTDDGNRLYRWDGVDWVEAGDQRVDEILTTIDTITDALNDMDGRIDSITIQGTTFGPTPPVDPVPDAMWFDGPVPSGPYQPKRWDDGTQTWVPTTFEDGAIAGLSVGKLIAGDLSVAFNIVAGGYIGAVHPVEGTVTRLTGSGMEYLEPLNAEGTIELQVVTRVGEAYSSGSSVFDRNGLATPRVDTSELYVGGVSIADMFGSSGIEVVGIENPDQQYGPYSSLSSYYRFAFDTDPNYVYFIFVNVDIGVVANTVRIYLLLSDGNIGTSVVPVNVNSTEYERWSGPSTSGGTLVPHFFTWYHHTSARWTEWLLAASAGGNPPLTWNNASIIVLRMPISESHIGNIGDYQAAGTAPPPVPPPPAPKRVTRTWTFADEEVYTSVPNVASHAIVGNKLRQGANAQVNYPYISCLYFSSAMTSALAGKTIYSAKLRMVHTGTYPSGTGQLGTHRQAAPSSTPPTRYTPFTKSSWAKGSAAEMALPSQALSDISAGLAKGIILGELNQRYNLMEFANIADSTTSWRPSITVEYLE